MNGVLDQWNCRAIHIGGVADHVHVMASLSRTHAPCRIVEELKKGSSMWIKTQGTGLDYERFYWQNGYGMFSIGQSQVPHVREYIDSQEEHHKCITFQDEYRTFLRKYGMEWDERYVWD
jgi:putative transposase